MHNLPNPYFSVDNPYWQDPAKMWGWLRPDYRPRLTARDFMFACTWEVNRPFDVHGAACVRMAMLQTVKLNWVFALRRSITNCLVKQRRTTHEAIC